MARIKGPNGLVLTVADDIAEGLVKSPAGDFEYVVDEKPKAAVKPSAKK